MRVAFKELPSSGQPFVRPVLEVGIAGADVRFGALVDTGSLHNRFARWTGEALGIDLKDGDRSRLAVGGVVVEAVTVPVEMTLAEWSWSAPVSFCEPWPFGFQLLGQEGFLRFFRVLLVAADSRLEIELDRG